MRSNIGIPSNGDVPSGLEPVPLQEASDTGQLSGMGGRCFYCPKVPLNPVVHLPKERNQAPGFSIGHPISNLGPRKSMRNAGKAAPSLRHNGRKRRKGDTYCRGPGNRKRTPVRTLAKPTCDSGYVICVCLGQARQTQTRLWFAAYLRLVRNWQWFSLRVSHASEGFYAPFESRFPDLRRNAGQSKWDGSVWGTAHQN